MSIFRAGRHRFDLTDRVLVMGVLNVTPDSFSDQGRYAETEAAVERGLEMAAAGADIIDIGGESTRPGAAPVPVEEELRRVLPVVKGLRAASDVLLSVDTYKSEVAEACLREDAEIVNDISGFHRDPRMGEVAARYHAGCVVMHMRGTPQTMQLMTEYADLLGEMVAYFEAKVEALVRIGIDRDYISIDPGIGFSKSAEQNVQLIEGLNVLVELGLPVLLGPSRKSFIGKLLGIADPTRREWGTAAAVACGVMRGARIVRVHDPGPMKEVAQVALAISRAGEQTSRA